MKIKSINMAYNGHMMKCFCKVHIIQIAQSRVVVVEPADQEGPTTSITNAIEHIFQQILEKESLNSENIELFIWHEINPITAEFSKVEIDDIGHPSFEAASDLDMKILGASLKG